ncbi:Signal transduction histidine kinase, phosphotransfer (Hpt) region [Candidatus Magnetoovum chiemensis]|nr:Signal transduction histidine kinase, phosphotransfer (Hpt) region [Candidatus Magnetoovum chiemensis]
MNELDELLDDFIIEADNRLLEIEQDLNKLVSNQDDPSLIDRIFRNIHTIKGNSGLVGLDKISKVSHSIEEVLHLIRSNKLDVSAAIIDKLFLSFDVLRSMINAVKLKTDLTISNYEELVLELEALKKPSCRAVDKQGKKQKLKILIADDDKLSANLLKNCLISLGSVDVVENGQDAIKAYFSALENDKPYDVIYLDILMPLIDGQFVLNKIRRYEKELAVRDEVKIFMVTDLDSPKEAIKSYFKGKCTDYIVKPIKQAKVLELLNVYFKITHD